MSIELMEFQQDYVEVLLDRIKRAKRHVQLGERQAVLLSAPTGSGKTVMLTALIEAIFGGAHAFEAEREAVFLWLSDQPELNLQTKEKILSSSTNLHEDDLVVLDADFDQEILQSGKVYFLNIQKLAKESRLTTKGDARAWTIWETINRSIHHFGDRFYLVLDEAHRGMNRSARAELEARTIVQKFILGSPGEIEAIPLIVGLSATPQRFERLINSSDRHLYKIQVDINRVKESGLLKDDLVLWMPDSAQPNNWSLLKAATQRWQQMAQQWATYCRTENVPVVSPAMVIQVENGDSSRNLLSKTDLKAVLDTIVEAVGPIAPDELVHCFEENGDIEIGSYTIRHVDPSRIQADSRVKFVLFKMALTTGWDCPRAEVMMSFRKVEDATLIAQLIGRMVRTPLARRIEGNDGLNAVHLYLPNYNRKNVDIVIQCLKDPEMMPVTEVRRGDRLRELIIDERFNSAYEALCGLPTYQVKSTGKLHDVRRLIKFASLLTIADEIDPDALSTSRKLLVDTIAFWKEKLTNEKSFSDAFLEANRIRVRPLLIDHEYNVREGDEQYVEISERNVDDLYRQSKQRLGDDICVEFLKTAADRNLIPKLKVELYLMLQNQRVWTKLQDVAESEIRRLKQEHQTKITSLSISRRARYDQLWSRAKNSEAISLYLPRMINFSIEDDETRFEKHLYVDEGGSFFAHFNSWENAVLNAEIPSCFTWLRNCDRKPWSIAYPYQLNGEWKAGYPDFIFIRKVKGQLIVDLFEPHSSSLADGAAKAKGLATFADKHGSRFGRIEIQRVASGSIQRLDLQNARCRERAMRLNNADELNQLFQAIVS